MSTSPTEALGSLTMMAADGRLDVFCAEAGIRLLIVFGSAVDPHVAEPRDLDIAVELAPTSDLVTVTTALVRLLSCDVVDVMNLGRASIPARAAAFRSSMPLFEDEAGRFARQSMLALAIAADTDWIRDLQLRGLAS